MFEKISSAIEKAVIAANSDEARPVWKRPLVTAVRADHPDFALLKTAASPTHLLPEDVLAGAKSVVCFFIPFEDHVVASDRGGEYASAEWAHAYIATNRLIATVSDRVERLLREEGWRAGKIPATHNFDEVTLMSDWSHRHIARIAGLGEFGINNMLITDAGCCGRLGSIVTDCELSIDVGISDGDSSACAGATATGAKSRRERCLNKINGSCGVCIGRCINGAYKKNAHGELEFDRARCYAICLANAEHHKAIGYADVCGKCLAGLPCSSRSPA